MDIVMTQYVVYENPKDYPGKFVVRKHFICNGIEHPVADPVPYMIEEGYSPIEDEMMRLGLYNLHRFPDDDPVIKEVWL